MVPRAFSQRLKALFEHSQQYRLPQLYEPAAIVSSALLLQQAFNHLAPNSDLAKQHVPGFESSVIGQLIASGAIVAPPPPPALLPQVRGPGEVGAVPPEAAVEIVMLDELKRSAFFGCTR